MNQMQLNFANNVKREMTEHGYDTYGLTEKIGVYPSTIHRLIHQERGVSLELATKLSHVLELTLDDLIKPTFKRSEVSVVHAKRLAELNRGGRKLYDTFHEFFADDEIDMEDEEVINVLNWFLATKKTNLPQID